MATQIEDIERGDQELSFKLLLKSLASKFEVIKISKSVRKQRKSAKIGGKSAKNSRSYGNFLKNP